MGATRKPRGSRGSAGEGGASMPFFSARRPSHPRKFRWQSVGDPCAEYSVHHCTPPTVHTAGAPETPPSSVYGVQGFVQDGTLGEALVLCRREQHPDLMEHTPPRLCSIHRPLFHTLATSRGRMVFSFHTLPLFPSGDHLFPLLFLPFHVLGVSDFCPSLSLLRPAVLDRPPIFAVDHVRSAWRHLEYSTWKHPVPGAPGEACSRQNGCGSMTCQS